MPEIAADAQAAYDAGAVAYVYGHDTRWNWGNGLATLGQPGEAAALDIAQDGILGGDIPALKYAALAGAIGANRRNPVASFCRAGRGGVVPQANGRKKPAA